MLLEQIHSRMKPAIFVLSFILMAIPANAQKQSSRLTGTVTDMDGKPIETAYVALNNSQTTITDAKGHFVFAGVPAGSVEYYVSCLGFKELRGKATIKGDGRDALHLKMQRIDLNLSGVTVTAQQRAMGSSSTIGQNAIRHIQPKSLADMLQLLPGSVTKNPTLNDLAQANIREIDGNDNNALGTAVIVDGTPLSNDANLQAISPTHSGNRSSSGEDGMNEQTTAGRGVDLRTVGADNIESVEVIRGIPAADYGNLTSGVVIVKTKAGRSPLEAKLKADPFSKLAYMGKGFSLGSGTMNVGVDWSQSWADTRRHYRGYDRITGSLGYSNVFNAKGEHPITLNVNGSFFSNINNYKRDPQMDALELTYKNKMVGGRLAARGHIQMDNFITGIDYDLSGQISRQLDKHHDLVSSPDGVISNAMTSGEHVASILNKAYFSDYKIEGIPINVYAQIKANKYIQLGETNYTNVKLGLEYRMDDNNGYGLKFDLAAPPKAGTAQTYRPRAYKDIPAMNTLSAFLSNESSFWLGATQLSLQPGLRISNLFLNKSKSGRGDIFVAEPRINAEYTFLTKKNNSIFDKLSISGGFGISNKMPTLLYLYPDKAYYDNVSLSAIGPDDSRLAVMTTKVIENTRNTDLKPARSTKWELGLNARIKQMKGYVNFFMERHRHEFGYNSQLVILDYNRYIVPGGSTNFAYQEGQVTYTSPAGEQKTAEVALGNEIELWAKPYNTSRTDKWGIEYSWDFGMFNPLSTSLVVDGAWFHIKRRSDLNHLNYISYEYDYIPLMPAGSGTVSDRVNTNFRFITHIPAVKLIFTTTLQVVWYENEQATYKDKDGNDLFHVSTDGSRYLISPIGFYNRQGQWTAWNKSFENQNAYYRMNGQYMLYAFNDDPVDPWALVNFRLTKELGKIAEVSFMANNFLNLKKYHTNRNYMTKSSIYPDMYFGAELKLKL